MTLQIEAVGITHRGAVRENNEDCIAIGYWVSQETMESARTIHHELDLPFSLGAFKFSPYVLGELGRALARIDGSAAWCAGILSGTSAFAGAFQCVHRGS